MRGKLAIVSMFLIVLGAGLLLSSVLSWNLAAGLPVIVMGIILFVDALIR